MLKRVRGEWRNRVCTVRVGIKLKFNGKKSKNKSERELRSMEKIYLDFGTDVLHSDL